MYKKNTRLRLAIFSKFKNDYEFASRCGVSIATVSRWIHGIQLPLKERLPDICAILKCKPEDIFMPEQINAMQSGTHRGRKVK